MVGAYCRGRLLDTVQLEKGQTEAVLRPSSGAGGVCRVTVFEELPTGRRPVATLKPVAERLVYRHPAGAPRPGHQPDQRRYVPGQKVNLSLLTTDEKEKPKPAILMVAVVDRSVLTLADEKTARAMPTHFLLTTEVRRAGRPRIRRLPRRPAPQGAAGRWTCCWARRAGGASPSRTPVSSANGCARRPRACPTATGSGRRKRPNGCW